MGKNETEKNHVVIDQSQCKGCKLCIAICPKKCLGLSAGINELGYQYAEFREEQCTACGLCYYMCPEPGAVTVHAAEKEGGKDG
jgi:NAD-dependent dihydropyrimidine dehydrogenase PreA subunit